MIQRIQSIYLLIAIISSVVAIVFFIGHDMLLHNATVLYPCFAVMGAVLSLAALLDYHHRKTQMKKAKLAMLALCLTLLIGILLLFNDEMSLTLTNKIIYVTMPAVAVVFNYLAWVAIRRDEQKVRSADRIR